MKLHEQIDALLRASAGPVPADDVRQARYATLRRCERLIATWERELREDGKPVISAGGLWLLRRSAFAAYRAWRTGGACTPIAEVCAQAERRFCAPRAGDTDATGSRTNARGA